MSLIRRLLDAWFERAAIYRVPFTDALDVELRVQGAERPIRFSRSAAELIGLGTRCYVTARVHPTPSRACR